MDLQLDNDMILKNINNRIEHHGDNRVTAVDLSFTGIIKADLLDQAMLDGNAISKAFWTKDGGVKYPQLGEQSITITYDEHKASIGLAGFDGDLPMIDLDNVTIDKLKFTPMNSDMAEIKLRVRCEIKGKTIGEMIDKYLGELIQVKTEAVNTPLELEES